MPVGSTMYLRGLSFIPLPISSHPLITSCNESPRVTIQILSPNSNLANLIWILPFLRHPVTSDLRLPQACRPGLPVLRQMLSGKPASATPCSLRPWNLPLMTSVTLPLSGSLPVLDQVLSTSNRPLAAPGCWHCPLLVNQSPTSRSQFFTMNTVQCTVPSLTPYQASHQALQCLGEPPTDVRLLPQLLKCNSTTCPNFPQLHIAAFIRWYPPLSFAQLRHIALGCSIHCTVMLCIGR